jgi:tripartite-type tricarboxylate transporter receptor subunit TctC
MAKFAATVAVALSLLPRCAAAATSVEDFYKSHTLFLQVGSSPGGFYDVTARLVARYIVNYIPGHPRIVLQQVPGGGSLLLANQFGNTTPRDGSVFGIFNDGMPTTPLTDPPAAHFDARNFNYIGSPTREAHILLAWKNSPVKTYDGIFKKELIVGASSPGASVYDFPLLTNALIGTKFKIVTGYEGGPSTKIAMSRGEINAEAGIALGSYQTDFVDEVKNGDVQIIAAFGMEKNPELQNVPLLPVGSKEDAELFRIMYARQNYGRLFLMPPGVPADRVAAMRTAFDETMKDPTFRADAKKAFMELQPVEGVELTKMTAELYQTPPAMLEKLQHLLHPKP